MIPIWVILLIIAIVILWIFRKIVIIPSISVTTDKASYDRSETVQIGGVLSDQTSAGIPGKTVIGAIEDPVGSVFPTIEVVTAADGSFATPWEIPDDAVGGTYTVTVSALGISASKTFSQMIQRVAGLAVWVPFK
ncbi:hypothetical protein KKH23_06570 [Patescibacteria group bacterium]|nr:hypothetical protein [Patescibacteria group bacterium]